MSEAVTEREAILGLKIDHLEKVDALDNPTQIFLDSHARSGKYFIESLHDFFVTHEDIQHGTLSYAWNIVLSGHGGTRYCPITDSYAVPVVADLTIENFKSVLQFLQHSISTKMFHFATCFGGGKRIEMLFDELGSNAYNFAILCEYLMGFHIARCASSIFHHIR